MNTVINICNEFDHPIEDGMLRDVLSMTVRHMPQAREINVFINPRVPDDAEPYKNPQWLEYYVQIIYHSGAKLSIGAIQRTKGAKTEFHS
jgi:hypothetical protein